MAAFSDGQGGYYTTAADAADVPLARPRTAADNATPAGNGLLAEVFARLWHLTGEAAWRERCRGAAAGVHRQSRSVRGDADAAGRGGPAGGGGDGGDRRAMPGRRPLAAAALAAARSGGRGAARADADALPAGHPAFGKPAGADGSVAYVCRRMVCGLPVADGKALAQALSTRTG